MKLLIVAGGGGHFAPALAVIEALPKDIEVLVVGRKYTFEGDLALSLEYRTAKERGISFIPLTTGRLQRKLSAQSVRSLLKVPVGYFQSIKILKDYRPDLVLSFGGYVSLPVALAAKTLSIPIIVHEQILGAGLANRLVAAFADKVAVSWRESAKYFPKDKVVVTGNPIRSSHTSGAAFPIPQGKLPLIYITGGSGGSHAINVLVEECLDALLEKYFVIHQTGDAKEFNDFDRLKKKKESLSKDKQSRYVVTKFIEPQYVFDVLKKADLVIARSGMNTVTELLLLGKPCLFIPLPYGQHNEQLTNAHFVKEVGIAEVVDQRHLTSEKLAHVIDTMMENISLYHDFKKDAQEKVITGGVANLISLIYDVNRQKKAA